MSVDPPTAHPGRGVRGWAGLGAGGAEWRQRNEGGWATLLPHYTAALTGP
ncbi:MAG TPA: hypothetical protein VGG05_08305 [Pseudonocardiaceae bacterium]